MAEQTWRTTAISSAVRRASVAIRQCSMTSSPSNRPSTVWVLPTSIVSSIDYPRRSRAMSRAGAEWVSAPTAR